MWYKIYQNIVFLFLLLLLGNAAQAQVGVGSRFSGGFLAGVNLSQLDGDSSIGYRKIGINVGIRGAVQFSPRTRMSVDLLYSERGSRSSDNAITRVITLNYLEVPVMFHYLDWETRDKGSEAYYKVGVSAGLIYSRLFNGSLDAAAAYQFAPFERYEKTDWGYVLAVHLMFSQHWGVQLRFQQSLNYLYDYEADTKKGFYPFSMKGYFFTVQSVFNF